MRYDFVIVGAGFTGAVLAERLASLGDRKILVIDRRDHIGGNARDRRNEHGVLYHEYGPHIFHTNAPQVVEYLSRFTEWTPYEHRVVGLVDGRLIPIPFNLTSLAILFPPARAQILAERLIATYGMEQKVPILKLRQSPDEELRKLAEFIYRNVFYTYTTKQWGLTPEQLSPSVTARVPVHISYDDRYFQDSFQSMPAKGYTALFERLLDHPNITLELSTEYRDIQGRLGHSPLVYTGAIDEYFGYALGALPYRSLRFDFQTYRQHRHQPAAQINYPMSHDFTRISEMGHMTQEWGDVTTVAIEYPQPHIPGVTIPYYPIPRDETRALHKRYLAHAAAEAPNVTFAGRLGDYQYYNMDQAVASALVLAGKLLAR